MIRRFFPLFFLVVVVAVSVQASLVDHWQQVQEGLVEEGPASIEEPMQALNEEAAELEVRRMTSFAAAMVAWAMENQDAHGEAIVRTAQQMDPELPSTYFLQSRWSWQRGAFPRAAGQYLSGWRALFEFEPTRRATSAWLVLWLVTSVGLTFIAMIVVVTVRHLRELAFDARELGERLFRPANALVFAVLVLLLPLFAGLGPIWLAMYLFSVSWIYLSVTLRVWAIVACLVLAFVIPALEWMRADLLKRPPVSSRVETMLEERQVDFATLHEFSELRKDLEEVATYHLILGELLRMHGEPGLAKVQYQKAMLADPDQAEPLIFLGNLAMEEGNTKRAIQYYNSALEADSQNAFAYHNLTLAFDLSRRFQEGDAARARAREIAGRGEAARGLRGRDPRIRYPRLGKEEVADLVGNSGPESPVASGPNRSSVKLLKQLLSPASVVFIAGGLVGLAVLFVRMRYYIPARECTKCGKVYRLEKGFGESSVYCSQCVSVFLKRDVVSIEQQSSKLSQIQRWENRVGIVRRVAGVLIPGSHRLVGERVWLGMLAGFAAWFFLTGALVWLPLFLPQIEPLASYKPAQVGLLVLFGLIVLRSAMVAWNRR
jgi:tetratricopeptide (TPR) repeat protein